MFSDALILLINLGGKMRFLLLQQIPRAAVLWMLWLSIVYEVCSDATSHSHLHVHDTATAATPVIHHTQHHSPHPGSHNIDISANDPNETLINLNERYKTNSAQKPNFLIILADDLGHGDTSVRPFVGSGIKTPELEKMAAEGLVMTNFHSAAATCTPTRASILTGLNPWRLGLKAVFEYGSQVKGKSNRDDWLAQVPTLAEVLREHNYSTGHSGKWHVGGMRNDDYDMRMLQDLGVDTNGLPPRGGRRCPHPGPNQQGFEDYVSVLDGPGAIRQNELQVQNTLYSQGCDHQLQNDKPIAEKDANLPSPGHLLSDCEAQHAIRMMKRSVELKKPFFQQVWFHAPHGPWETIDEFTHLYPDNDRSKAMESQCEGNPGVRFCRRSDGSIQDRGASGGTRFHKYRTMVSMMDRSIGLLLKSLRDMGVERNTMVIFLSDNGPEDDAGTVKKEHDRDAPFATTSGLRGSKRYLFEGGIRVPSIWSWPGVIPRGKYSNALSISTDIYPTILDAAGITLPQNYHTDGMSIFPDIVSHTHHLHNRRKGRRAISERLLFWAAEYEGPRATASIAFDFKLMLNDNDVPQWLFDLRADPRERKNLLPDMSRVPVADITKWDSLRPVDFRLDIFKMYDPEVRNKGWLHKYIVAKLYPYVFAYVRHGNEAHQMYVKTHYGRHYNASVRSNERYMVGNPYRNINKQEAERRRNVLLTEGTCTTPCPCQVPYARDIPDLYGQFDDKLRHKNIMPMGFINASQILNLYPVSDDLHHHYALYNTHAGKENGEGGGGGGGAVLKVGISTSNTNLVQ